MAVSIGSANNRRHGLYSGIIDLVFLYQVIKRTLLSIVRMLYIRNIKRNGIQGACLAQYFPERHIDNFRIPVYKPAYQPGTGNTVYLWVLARDPFHKETIERN